MKIKASYSGFNISFVNCEEKTTNLLKLEVTFTTALVLIIPKCYIKLSDDIQVGTQTTFLKLCTVNISTYCTIHTSMFGMQVMPKIS